MLEYSFFNFYFIFVQYVDKICKLFSISQFYFLSFVHFLLSLFSRSLTCQVDNKTDFNFFQWTRSTIPPLKSGKNIRPTKAATNRLWMGCSWHEKITKTNKNMMISKRKKMYYIIFNLIYSALYYLIAFNVNAATLCYQNYWSFHCEKVSDIKIRKENSQRIIFIKKKKMM